MIYIEIERFDASSIQGKMVEINHIENDYIVILFPRSPLIDDHYDVMRYLECMIITDKKFELRWRKSSFSHEIDNKWNGEIFTCYEDYFLEYWYQYRQMKVIIKRDINKDLKTGGEYTKERQLMQKNWGTNWHTQL